MLAVPGFEFIAPMGLLSCVSVELRCCPGMLPRKLFLTAASLAPDVLSGGREVMSEENSRLLVSRGAAAAAHGRSYVAVLLWHFPGGRVWICAILCLTQSWDLTKVDMPLHAARWAPQLSLKVDPLSVVTRRRRLPRNILTQAVE